VNYFVGSNPSAWRTDIPTYGRVRYPGVYPGIDVVYYGNQGKLEYDFVLAPNSDSSRIRLAITGGGRLSVDREGILQMSGTPGLLRQEKPIAYQTEPDGGRMIVDCRYVVSGAGEVGFRLGAYDRSRSLTIDPVLSYSTFIGGNGNDGVTALQVDSTGSAYFTGYTTSSNFPVTGGVQNANRGASGGNGLASFGDVFVSKLNPAGTALAYSTYLGGANDEVAVAITVDSTGNAFVAGSTRSTNFPTTAGAIQTTFGGVTAQGFYSPGDAFVAKLNATGNQLLYSTYLGGSLNDMAWGIATDTAGNAVVAGNTTSTNFPTANAAFGAFRGVTGSASIVMGDGFVAKLNPTGTALLYSTYLGGRANDMAKGVALDVQGNAYVGGSTYSSDFPVSEGAFQTVFRGNPNGKDVAFLAKMSPQGTLTWATYLGGSGGDGAWAVTVDPNGNGILAGRTSSTDFPVTAGAIQATYKGSRAVGQADDVTYGDGFVAKLNATGTALIYSTYLGGAGDEVAISIASDSAGNAYASGFSLSRDFPVSADALQNSMAGFGGQGGTGLQSDGSGNIHTGDAFVVKISPTGAMLYSSYFGARGDDASFAITVDPAGSVYIGGVTVSTDFGTTAGIVQSTFGGLTPLWPRGDGFVSKFSFGGTLPAVPARFTLVPGTPTSGTVGVGLGAPMVVEVLDAQLRPVAGITVAFTSVNASVNPASAVTDATGRASTTVTPGSTVGAAAVTAAIPGLPSVVLNVTVNAAVIGPAISAVVNGASFLAAVSPGSWITLFGQNLATQTAQASAVPFPVTLAGVQVLVNGIPAPLYVVTAGQINVQLPYEIPVGPATAVVKSGTSTSAPMAFTVSAAAPGVFVFGTNRAVVQNVQANGALTVNTGENPVPAGGLIIAYLTGQGPLDNPVPTGDVAGSAPLSRPALAYSVTIGGMPAVVDFMGMTPGQIALLQANIVVPASLSPGDYPVVVTVGGARSNGPVITVTNPLR
jgi:uncharacterized protein (TIGR03437 family)